jgi:ABC-type transport system involved in cytochrome c biogenesis permease component
MVARALTRAADWVVPGDNPTGVIYGVIVIAALLAAESGSHESYLDTVGSALVATGLYWFAHAYAGLLGGRLSARERLTAAALWQALSHNWALVRGAAVPLLALACGWVAGASQQTSVTAALWTSMACLVGLELVAGVRSHAGARELALDAGVGAAMGLAILAVKVLLHH